MKRFLLISVILIFSYPANLIAEDVFGISAKCDRPSVSDPYLLTIKRHNITQGTDTILRNNISCTGVSSDSEVDTVNGLFYVKQGDGSINIYDYVNDSIVTTSGYSGASRFVIPYSDKSVSSIVTTGTDSEDGSTTTILGSLDIKDSSGTTLIENKADGSTHIGENSLVTQEVNGRQELYATNAAGNQIDLNIKKGTNLLIDGVNVMDAIHGSVAMGAAMASLPTSAGDAQYTCGLGTGFHNSSTAISGGCGFDFKNFDFVETMPKAFHDASFNFGVASVVEGEQDGASLKAGITFKFGSPKKIKTAEAIQFRTENKIDAVMQENKILKDQIAAINLKLETLNMVTSN